MKKAVLCGPTLGEFYWEFGRFAPYVIYLRTIKYKNRNDVDFIILTRPENFDIYGKHASILVPFRLKNNKNYKADCFKSHGISDDEYLNIIKIFKKQYSERYKILETVYPNISKRQYTNKNQYAESKKVYDYKPRTENNNIIEKNIIDKSKPFVVLSPRFREGLRRNWPHWQDLYDLIGENKELNNKYTFVICGKNPDYVGDIKNRYLDINNLEQNINTSLAGMTIECIKKSKLTIGSQSAIPNISLLLKVPVLEWGHQRELHSKSYNPFNTKINFIEDLKYNISPEKIYKEILKILK